MNNVEFRDALKRLDLTRPGLARLFQRLGHEAELEAIVQRLDRMADGSAAKIPGEVVAFLALLQRFPAVLAELRDPPPPPRRESVLRMPVNVPERATASRR